MIGGGRRAVGVVLRATVLRAVVLGAAAVSAVLLFTACEISRYPYYVETERLNLSLVIDRSGSMRAGTRMEDAREAAVLLVEQLHGDDVVSVIAFDNAVETVVPATRLSRDNRDDTIEAIRGIQPGGGTTVSIGLEAGYEELGRFSSPAYWNILVLLCDGDVDMAVSEQYVITAYNRGIRTSTVGLAVEERQMNDLRRLADLGDGIAVKVADGEDVAAAMQQAVDKILSP